MKESIKNFNFVFNGYGHYVVQYKSPKTNKVWSKLINDMTIIDLTKNEDSPTQRSLQELKRKIKNY
jgi:DNA modification methylase